MTDTLAAVALGLAGFPAALFTVNVAAYQPPPAPPRGYRPSVSVLIPARNEEASIGGAVEAALASEDVDLEVIVLDDQSDDDTAAIVAGYARRDARVRIERAPPLPAGWCGKQHACWALSQLAAKPLLCFVDADVRLTPQGLVRLAAFLEQSKADLVSGFPRQETGTWLERLLIPCMHFLLLSYLPVPMMRRLPYPSLGAGCGQLFLSRRDAYDKAGGHGAIRTSLHDGVTLPPAYRRVGLRTDLCDTTEVARCRMYHSAAEVWRGLGKNATEGLASPGRIVPWTMLLLGGHVLPAVLIITALAGLLSPRGAAMAWAALALSYVPRLTGVVRFRQSLAGALGHPLAVLLLVVIQWAALARSVVGAPSVWKGRAYQG